MKKRRNFFLRSFQKLGKFVFLNFLFKFFLITRLGSLMNDFKIENSLFASNLYFSSFKFTSIFLKKNRNKGLKKKKEKINTKFFLYFFFGFFYFLQLKQNDKFCFNFFS